MYGLNCDRDIFSIWKCFTHYCCIQNRAFDKNEGGFYMIFFAFTIDTGAETDQEYLERLYKKYNRLMFATAHHYFADSGVCEDIVQDAIVNLCSKAKLLRGLPNYAVSAYIVFTVKNVAIIQHRHQHRINIPLCISLGLSLIQSHIRTRKLVSQDIGLRLSLFLPRCARQKLIAQPHQLQDNRYLDS